MFCWLDLHKAAQTQKQQKFHTVMIPFALQEEILSHLLKEPYVGNLMLVQKRWRDALLSKHWVLQQAHMQPSPERWPALYEKPWQETPQEDVLLGRALADCYKSTYQIFTAEPRTAFQLGFRHHTFNLGHGNTVPPCSGPLYVMEYKGGSRFKESLDPYFSLEFLPDPTKFLAAISVEEMEDKIKQGCLLSQLMSEYYTAIN